MSRGSLKQKTGASLTGLRKENPRGVRGHNCYRSNRNGYFRNFQMKKLDLESSRYYSSAVQEDVSSANPNARGVTYNETRYPHFRSVHRLRRRRRSLRFALLRALTAQPSIGHSRQPGSALCPWTAWLPGRTITTVYAKVMPRKCHRCERIFGCESES